MKIYFCILFFISTISVSTLFGNTLPAKIEAEDWDSFFDSSASPGVQTCTDIGGGSNVGWITEGEWLSYTLSVPDSGEFRFSLRAASAISGDKSFHLEVDGIDRSGSVVFPHSDGWQSWHTVSFAPLQLEAGSHEFRLVFDTGDMNVNWLQFELYQAQPLSAPNGFSLDSATTDGAQLSWLDSFEDESSYALYLSTTPEQPSNPHTTFPADSTSGALTDLSSGQRYYLWLEAINSVGNGAAAELDFFTLTTDVPEAISVGAGSYAAYPPYTEGNDPGVFQNYATNTHFNTVSGETRPIPTNDWWTHLLFNETDSALWIYPQMLQTINEGFRLFFPRTFNESGTNIELGAFIMITGENFTPSETVAKDWSDWGLVATRKNSTQRIDASIAHGIPMTYFETEALDATLRFGAAARFFDSSSNELSFPNNEEVILITMDGAYYGLHVPANTTVSKDGNNLTIDCDFFTLSVLPDAEALNEFHAHAFNIPRKTEVNWSFDAENARLRNTWSILTENPSGAPAGPVLQGFLPHHFNDLISQNFVLSDHSYITTRGDLTLVSGNSFSMEYSWHGILPHYPSPDAVTGDAPWRPEVMDAIITDYAANANYGSDTYWGGKDLIEMAKYMLFARDTGHDAYPTIKAQLKEALADWLTYTPGETERYYAHYPAWGGLVGFNESYYSYQFTDHHFHYGYLIHAAALMAMDEPEWIEPYAPMLKLVAKEYANWERADSDFPFLRNFDPWMGHSYAGGVGSPGGNNQESTSEAVQSWAALFYLGALLGDDAMRDAGAFGYQAESNATMEYWFNRSGTNWNQAYADAQDVIGVLWNGGYVYGTFFSAAPQHIYGIQWLPVIPAFKHLAKGVSPEWSDALYQELLDRILVDLQNNEDPAAADGVISEVDVGTDWANVLLGFRLFSHPEDVTAKLENWKDSLDAEEREVLFSGEGGLTYYYAHAHTSWGAIDWDVQFSLPMATAFTHPETGLSTYVIFNEAREERVCEIRRNGNLIASVRVPALTTVAHKLDSALHSIDVRAPSQHVNLGEVVPLSVIGYDQYGARFPLSNPQISSTEGGAILSNHQFMGLARNSNITVIAEENAVSGRLNLQVGDPVQLSNLSIEPEFSRMETSSSDNFTLQTMDQYGEPHNSGLVVWSCSAGSIDETGTFTAPDDAQKVRIVAEVDGLSAVSLVSVHDPLNNLALNQDSSASTNLGTNSSSKAFDGNTNTRWESTHGLDDQFLTIDLGAQYELDRLVLNWETAAAASYTIDVSSDNQNWETIFTETNGNAGVDSIRIQASARYIRLSALSRTTIYGFSLWEFEVYGHPHHSNLNLETLAILPEASTLAPLGMQDFKAYAFDAHGNGVSVDPTWDCDLGTIDSDGSFYAHSVPGTASVHAQYNSLTHTANVQILNTPRPGYAEWSALHNLSESQSGLFQDPDRDGIPNISEHYFNTDPNVYNQSYEIASEIAGNSFQFSFNRSISAANETSLHLERSEDLKIWVSSPPESFEVVPHTSTLEEVFVGYDRQHETNFYRLRIGDN